MSPQTCALALRKCPFRSATAGIQLFFLRITGERWGLWWKRLVKNHRVPASAVLMSYLKPTFGVSKSGQWIFCPYQELECGFIHTEPKCRVSAHLKVCLPCNVNWGLVLNWKHSAFCIKFLANVLCWLWCPLLPSSPTRKEWATCQRWREPACMGLVGLITLLSVKKWALRASLSASMSFCDCLSNLAV